MQTNQRKQFESSKKRTFFKGKNKNINGMMDKHEELLQNLRKVRSFLIM